VVWLTGLSGSGKSTVAVAVEAALVAAGHAAYVLDGDNVRHGLNRDLGFAPEDRAENIRRVGEVAALFADAGLITLTAFISPYRADREAARAAVGAERFLEVFVDTPLEVCERRDPKQLYRRARAGEVGEFTGVSAPYEPPASPALALDTSALDAAACVERVVTLLRERGFLPGGEGAA
jgi:adenylyl-sulfate kinase